MVRSSSRNSPLLCQVRQIMLQRAIDGRFQQEGSWLTFSAPVIAMLCACGEVSLLKATRPAAVDAASHYWA
jgi:hypothetical protein